MSRLGPGRLGARAWSKTTVLITSGPTRERLDPVRYLTNASSGRTGWALAREARRRGARVIVVSGPAAEPPPAGVRVVSVESALEMRRAALRHAASAGVVIGAAAVSDWRPAALSRHKLKRGRRALRLTLLPNPDIIAEIGRRRRRGDGQVVVGFALETRGELSAARQKLRRKGLDLVVANGPSSLDGARSRAALVRRGGAARRLPELSKRRLAAVILDEVEALWRAKSS